jgi:hypothetical protein
MQRTQDNQAQTGVGTLPDLRPYRPTSAAESPHPCANEGKAPDRNLTMARGIGDRNAQTLLGLAPRKVRVSADGVGGADARAVSPSQRGSHEGTALEGKDGAGWRAERSFIAQ